MNRTRNPGRSRSPRGFTLVEMLVVVVIIGILAAILIPAVYSAILAAKNAAIKAELASLAQGVEAYRSKYGDFPPDWSDANAVRRHYKKLFPRMSVADSNQIETYLTSMPKMTQAQALVFALQGYSPDVLRPITGTGKQSLYDFDQSRLVIDNSSGAPNVPFYRPANLQAAYVYFDAKSYNNGAQFSAPAAYGTGVVTPYKIPDGSYANAKSFQILGAGLDDNFGIGNRPVWSAVTPGLADSDNVTNFNQASTLQGDLP